MEACTPTVAYQNHVWAFETNNPAYIEPHTTCGEPPLSNNPPTLANLSLGDTLGPFGVPVGVYGKWQFIAPPSTTISGISGSDSLMKVGGNKGWNVYLESEDTEGHTQVAQTCSTSAEENECTVSGPFDLTDLHAKAVTIGAECNAEEYAPGKTYNTCSRGNEFGHAVRAGFNSVIVTLTDPNGPTNITASNIPTEPQHNSITILGSATDTVAGLLSLQVIDNSGNALGNPVASEGCNYSLLTPCPTNANDIPLPLDTDLLPEGPNQIRIIAINAAHEDTTSPPYTIVVENHPARKGIEPGESIGHEGTNSQTNTTTTTTTTTDTSPTPNSINNSASASHPPLRITLATPRLRHEKLLLAGTVTAGAHGVLRLTVRGHLLNGHRWTAKTQISLAHAHFSCTIRLTKRRRRSQVTLEVIYPGSTSYQATQLWRTVNL